MVVGSRCARRGRSNQVAVLLLALAGGACGERGEARSDGSEAPDEAAEAASPVVDPALLTDLLGEAVRVGGARAVADGLLVRLAFEPLIRQTGPAHVQKVQGQGYRLLGVSEGSPLWQLGLREGDVLTKVDGEPILGREHELRSIWERRPPRAELSYVRDEQSHTLKLKVRSGVAWQGEGSAEDRLAAIRERRAERERLRPPLLMGEEAEPGTQLDFAANVRCVPGEEAGEAGRCELTRALVDELAQNPARLAKQARVVPSVREGETEGFKFYAIRRGSLLGLIGLKNGDLLRSIDGHELDGADAALAVYEQLRGKDEHEHELELERRGKPLRLTLVFVDELSK